MAVPESVTSFDTAVSVGNRAHGIGDWLSAKRTVSYEVLDAWVFYGSLIVDIKGIARVPVIFAPLRGVSGRIDS